MVAQENDPIVNETPAENSADVSDVEIKREDSVPDESASCPVDGCRRGKCGGLKVLFFLVLIAVAGLFAYPKTRGELIARYNAWQSKKATTVPAAVLMPAQKISAVSEKPKLENRVEQLENARDFAAAEVVATTEPVVDHTAEDLARLQRDYAALAAQTNALRAEIADLKKNMPKAGLIEERLLMMNAKDDALEQQLVETGVKLSGIEKNKADAASVLALVTRQDITERKLRAANFEKDKAAALLFAVYQMREAALAGQPFVTEQQSALALAAFSKTISEQIRSLETVSATGVATRAALLTSFSGYADSATLANETSDKQDWFHSAVNSLRKLVVVRRLDAPADDPSVSAVLARAQSAIDAGDIATAVERLQMLNGAPADAMRGWMSSARGYLAVKKRINEIIASALAVIYTDSYKGE